MEKPKKSEKFREFLITGSVIMFILSYGAFITFRIIKGEWVWRPLGYISIAVYAVYILMQIFDKERQSIEVIVFKMLLAFNFITML